MRPSDLYGITWPLAAFFLDRGLYRWANFVDRTVNEAEMRTRQQLRRAKNVDMFVTQARTVAYNKLMGLSVASAYRQPDSFDLNKGKAKKPEKVGPHIKQVSGESNLDWASFNK